MTLFASRPGRIIPAGVFFVASSNFAGKVFFVPFNVDSIGYISYLAINTGHEDGLPDLARDEWREMMMEIAPHIEAKARELYEASRKRVSGRPAWEKLNPNDDYDMGMRNTAIRAAVDALDPWHDRTRHYDSEGYCDNPARGY